MNNTELQTLIDEVKKSLPLDRLFQYYGLKPAKTKRKYTCPFHDDSTPSLSLTEDLQHWQCFGCQRKGDAINFIEQHEHSNWTEAFTKAADYAGIHLEPKCKIKQVQELQAKHYAYLRKVRGIKKATANKLGLKARRDYILFPQYRRGALVGYKLRHMTDKSKMQFEGLDRTSKWWPQEPSEASEIVWVVSGEYEACLLTQAILEAKLEDHMVITNSTGEGSYPKDALDSFRQLPNLKAIHILYDNDQAGKNGAHKLAQALAPLDIPIRIYHLPQDKPEKYDLVDFFKEGATLQDVMGLKFEIFKPIPEDLMAEIQKSITSLNRTSAKRPETRTIGKYTYIEPDNYRIKEDGVFKMTIVKGDPRYETISTSPILITGEASNTDEDTIKLELVFKRGHYWKKFQVEREILSDARKIIHLSANGFPVHSGNSKKMVEYLHVFETENYERLPKVYITQTNGWKHFNSEAIYGLGPRIIGLNGEPQQIAFVPGTGFESFSKALHSNGTLDKWKGLMQRVLNYPKATLALYASFAAPLLHVLDAPNFIIHYWGDSSMGKTTALEIAASVWGNPAKEAGGLVTSWNNTQVFVERIAGFFNDLPLCLDDCQTTDDKVLSKVLYMIANSVGRGRGAKSGGVQDLAYWHTVCFSNGEKPLTDSTQYDGAKARTIELAGSPFGRSQAKLVNDIKSGIREHYGLAGPLFISYVFELLRQPEGRQELKSKYRRFHDVLAELVHSEIGDRLAHYFAAIWLAADLVEKCFQLGGDYKWIIKNNFEEFIQERQGDGDNSTRALATVISYAQANSKSFLGKGDSNSKEHFGIWKDFEYIAFYPHKLKEILAKEGFSFSSVVRSWAERNWIRKEASRQTYKVWFENNQYRMVVLKWESIRSVIE